MSSELTIADEIARLKAEASRLDWESRNPRACPHAAWEAEERLRVTLERIADLRANSEPETITPQ